MGTLATFEAGETFSRITFADGKANVMSAAMLQAIDGAFDQAEAAGRPVLLSARGKHFSGGFDLNVFATGSPEEIHAMLRGGAELALRLLGFPLPIVAACQGNAYPMGAFLLLASDYRLGGEGDWRIGLNEVAIGLTLPRFAVELARNRLQPAYFNRTIVAEMFAPREAVVAGYLDRVVPADRLEEEAARAAGAMAGLDLVAHAGTKTRVRGAALEAMRRVIDEDLTLDYARERVAARAA